MARLGAHELAEMFSGARSEDRFEGHRRFSRPARRAQNRMTGYNPSHVEALIYKEQGEDDGYDDFHSETSGR